MKWRYRNEEESNAPIAMQIPNIVINSSDEMQSSSSVKVINNKILFYLDIDENTVSELNKVLYELDGKLQSIKNIGFDKNYDPIIDLPINTFGGSIFSAFSTVDTIRRLKTKVDTSSMVVLQVREH